MQVRLSGLELKRPRIFGSCWLACELWQQLGLDEFWQQRLPEGRETVSWEKVLRLLVVNRLLDPGSEFRVHRQWYLNSAMDELLDVKVDHGANVRARTGYCNSKPKDLLAQSPLEKLMESRATSAQPGNVAATMQAPYFYTSDNVARVNVAMEISPEEFKFDKEKGRLRSVINILGVAYRPDGSVGARFSDSVKLEFDDKKQVEAFKENPYHYENQFDIASGSYALKLVVSSGGASFAKVEAPLVVEPHEAKQFGVSPPAFSTHVRSMTQMDVSMDAALIEDRKPLVASGYEIIPTGTNKFKKTDKPNMYLEVYEPALITLDPAKPVIVAVQMQVLDSKTGEKKVDTGLFRINVPEKGGNPTIPVGLKVPIDTLAPGNYRLALIAADNGGASAKRLADFVIE